MRLRKVRVFTAREIVSDMLRYDLAFQNPERPNVVIYPTFGNYYHPPTFGRWESFGVKLLPTDDIPLETVISEAESWFSHRGVTLKECLDAPSIYEAFKH